MKTTIVIFLTVFCIKCSFAQFENTDIGARATGLGGAFTSLSNNSLAVFYNPSGLGQMNFREISVFYNPSPYGISEITSASLTFAEPLKFGTLGIGIKSFGFDLYRETSVNLSYGNVFKSKFFYGFNLNYYNLNIKNYNSAGTFGADIGALAYITPFLRWGFFAKNISGAKIGNSGEKLAQIYKTGITVQPGYDINLILEVEKDVKYPVSFRGGFEYFINDFIDIRTGIGTEPASFSGGISLNYNIFQIEYAFSNVNELGISNQGSVTINFGGNKARKNAQNRLKNSFIK